MRKIPAPTHTVTIFHGGSDFDEIDPSYFGRGEPGNIRPLGKGLYGGLAVHSDEHEPAIETARHFAKKYGNSKKGKTIHAFQIELPAEIKNLASFDDNLGQPIGTKTRMGSLNNKDILGRGDWEAEALGNGDKEISINTPSMLSKLRRVGKWSADTPTEKIIADLNSTKVNEEMKKIPALLEKYMVRENAQSFMDELNATTDRNSDDPEWEDMRRLKDGSASVDAVRLGISNSIYVGNLVAHKPLGGLKALRRIRELADKHGTTVHAMALAYKSKEDSPENQNIITDTPKLKRLYTHFGASEDPKSVGNGMRYDPKEKFDHYVEWTPSKTKKLQMKEEITASDLKTTAKGVLNFAVDSALNSVPGVAPARQAAEPKSDFRTRLKKGDNIGAGLSMASSVASSFPGPGTAVSKGLNAVGVARDFINDNPSKGSAYGGSGMTGSRAYDQSNAKIGKPSQFPVKEDADSFMQELNDTTDEHPLNHKLRVMPDYSASIEASKYSDDGVYIDGLKALKPGGGLNAMRHIKKLADRHEVVLKAKAFAFMKKPSSNNPSIMTDTDRLVKLYKHFGGSEDPLPDGPRRYGVNMTYTSPNYTPPEPKPEEPQPKDGVIRLRGFRRQH